MGINRARELRNNLTEAELTLWKQIRLRQLSGYKFRRQHPIGEYVADFVCLEKRLIIEVDGGQHSEQGLYDQIRNDWLKSQGFCILRFWNHEVMMEIEGVKEVILKTLEDTPHLNPPPHVGRRLTA